MSNQGFFCVILSSIAALLPIVGGTIDVQTSERSAESATDTANKSYDWKSSFAKVPTGKVPRQGNGRPDLQGIWSHSTLTPLERRGSGAKTEISSEEAEEAEDIAQKKAVELRVEPTITPPGEKTTDAYNSFWRDGYWYKVPMTTLHTSQVVDPPDGRIPPLTPDARARLANANMKLNRPAIGPEDRPVRSRCVRYGGSPFIGQGPGAQQTDLEIVQSPDVVAVRVDDHEVQIIPLSQRPPLSSNIHLDKGSSVGHWEGDTLVVETTNFKAWGMAPFDAYGTTEKAHLTERWKRLDDTHMLYGFTIEDPGTWTKPWSVEYIMWRETNQEELVEYACHEGNVGLEFTLSAARTKEKQAETGSDRK